jgi:hypothetical protein
MEESLMMRLVRIVASLGLVIIVVSLSAPLAGVAAPKPAKKNIAVPRVTFAERRARVSRVAGEVLAGAETRENLRVLCDDVGGRVAGTPSSRKAIDFASGLLTRYGLRNVHEETFEFPGWVRGPFRCEVTSPGPWTMHALALANTPSTPPEGVEAEVIDAAHGNPVELDKLGSRLEGRYALVLDEVMSGGRWMHRSEVLLEVYKRGAAGLLYETPEPGQLPMTGTCWNTGIAPIPAAGISKEDGEWVRRELERGVPVRVRVTMTNEAAPATSANLVGELPGRGGEFVVVGAHLDAWDVGRGAVDNGTGVAVVAEAARALARSGIEPAATIRFVFFMGEESGLYGSNAYVARHAAELGRCRAMINCDMEGLPVGIRVMGHEEAQPFFEELLESLGGFDLPSGISHRAGIHGDQQAFLLAGVPVVVPISRFDGEGDRYYHTAADTYDKVTSFRQLNLCAAFVGVLASELAWPERRVMERLDENGVRALIKANNLEDALNAWNAGSDPR